MKHVDRKALYTRLEARITYLRDFLDFNSGSSPLQSRCLRSSTNRMDVGDVEALVAGSKYIKALIPAVVNIVYKKLLESDITARAFHTRDTADDTPVEEFFTEESPQIQRRKMFLRWYLIKLCSDPSQMEFWRYLNKVGYVFLSLSRSVCTTYHVTLTVIE